MSSLTPNVVVHGDCLAAFGRIDPGSVGLVFVDPTPPEGSSQARTRRRDPAKEVLYPDGLRDHLTFIGKVFQHAHKALSADGTLFVYSGALLRGYYRVLLDQVFGPNLFWEEFVLKWRPPARHGTVLFYAKSGNSPYNRVTRRLTDQESQARFGQVDEGGPHRLVDATVLGVREHLQFDWHGALPPRGRSWRYSLDTLEALQREGRLVVGPGGRPRLKVYLADSFSEVELGSIWDDLPLLRRSSLGRQLPVDVMKRIISIGSVEGAVVCDPLCGSGTTLLAAHQLGRRWIGVDCDADACAMTTRGLRELGLEEATDFTTLTEEELNSCAVVADARCRQLHLGLGDEFRLDCVLDCPLPIEETRHYEFKEILGTTPLNAIKNSVDEYAVAFLNCEGGRIFWGVRNTDRCVVGFKATYRQRDDIRQIVVQKLHGIRPPVSPSHWRITFHAVQDGTGRPVEDTFVLEVIVPRIDSRELFNTEGDQVFIKTDAGKVKLTLQEVYAERRRRGLQ
jgi:hypothetical protein